MTFATKRYIYSLIIHIIVLLLDFKVIYDKKRDHPNSIIGPREKHCPWGPYLDNHPQE